MFNTFFSTNNRVHEKYKQNLLKFEFTTLSPQSDRNSNFFSAALHPQLLYRNVIVSTCKKLIVLEVTFNLPRFDPLNIENNDMEIHILHASGWLAPLYFDRPFLVFFYCIDLLCIFIYALRF